MATISIVIRGDKEVISTLKSLSNEFKDFTQPLSSASIKYHNVILSNFTDEGKTFSKPWPPLSPATVEIKKALKAEGKSKGTEKPLYRTGKLRSSFNWNIKGKNLSILYNETDYAQIHQEGGTVFFKGRQRKVPRRVLAEVDDKRIEMVGTVFVKWIKDLFAKYKVD